MAEYYFEFGFVSRSNSSGKAYGKNSIAKAAYDSRDKLVDERTGKTYDYRYKGLPEETAIFLPEDAPQWMRNRKELWNAVEKHEDEHNRKAQQATPSRTFKIGIPCELDTQEKRRRFFMDYGRTLSRQGYVADLSIHPPDGKSPNWHIHGQLVLREISAEGLGNRIRLNGPEHDNDSRKEMTKQKVNLCNLAARHIERYGHKLEGERFRVAYQTIPLQRQDAMRRGDLAHAKALDREPTEHMGPVAWKMDKEGKRTRVGDRNKAIKARNAERQLEGEREDPWLGGRFNGKAMEDPTDEKFQELRNRLDARKLRADMSLPPSDIRGDAEHIWWAFKNAKDAPALAEDIKQRGLHLARITADDAQHSLTTNFLDGTFHDKYSPKHKEGEYVAINDRGWVYRLNEITTEKSAGTLKAFMRGLDAQPIPSLRSKWNELHDKRQKEIDPRPYKRPVTREIKHVVRKAARLPGRAMDQVPSTVRTGRRVLGLGLGIFGLLDPPLTPEQKKNLREEAEHRKEEARVRKDRSTERER